jgi:hypothetical protein
MPSDLFRQLAPTCFCAVHRQFDATEQEYMNHRLSLATDLQSLVLPDCKVDAEKANKLPL